MALSRVFNSVAESLEERTVRWFTDSKNVVKILKVGSRKPKLQNVATTVVSGCQDKDVTLNREWVYRDQNVQADFLSRCYDSDDWQIAPLIFACIDKIWAITQKTGSLLIIMPNVQGSTLGGIVQVPNV